MLTMALIAAIASDLAREGALIQEDSALYYG
jgi:hypothetical protein